MILAISACSAIAQTSPIEMADKNDDNAPSFKFGIKYLSNDIFFGRADSVKTPAIVPELRYTFANGIYLLGNADYITNRLKNKIDGGSVAAGYDHDFTDDLDGGISVTKLFYNANSTQIGSSISTNISADLNYDIAGIITPSVSVDYNFVKKGFGNDVFVNVGVTHDFINKKVFGDDDELSISPTVEMNNGTQNFYDAFLTLKKYKLTGAGQTKGSAAKKLLTAQQKALGRFNLLDYELSAPVEYKTGHLVLTFNPTYAIAENKLTSRSSSTLVSGNGIFYFEAGVALKF